MNGTTVTMGDAEEALELEALQHKLARLKDAHPDGRRIWVQASEGTRLADFVAVWDHAREVRDPANEPRTLFDQIQWVVR